MPRQEWCSLPHGNEALLPFFELASLAKHTIAKVGGVAMAMTFPARCAVHTAIVSQVIHDMPLAIQLLLTPAIGAEFATNACHLTSVMIATKISMMIMEIMMTHDG